MDKFEKLVQEIIADAEKDGEPVTREEAEEMARMELGAKELKRYERSVEPIKEKNKGKKKRTVKTSAEKIELFNTILANLDRAEGVTRKNITVLKENKLIQVRIGEKKFIVDLIECRK